MKQIQQSKKATISKGFRLLLLTLILFGLFQAFNYSSLTKNILNNQNSTEQLPPKNDTEIENSTTTQTETINDFIVKPKEKPTFQSMLSEIAELRLQSDVTYDGRYEEIAYPMGDVPANIGVCTDVVIRSYRGMGIDLQQRVHEDMKSNFRAYPTKWKLRKPDTNIDHRRVPNLMTYFKRTGASLPISEDPYDYETGHIVTWDLGKGLVHIGIVSDKLSMITGHPLIIHNIGAGPEMSDILFRYKITGHYKYGASTDVFPKIVSGTLQDTVSGNK